MLSVISNIDYNILYSSLFELSSKSIISFRFDEISNIDYFFTFLGIDSNPDRINNGLYNELKV